MDQQTVLEFLQWCTIINGSLLTFWVLALKFIPDLTYRSQITVIDLPRESFNIIMYSFLAIFKIMFLVFNVVPLLALAIMR